jgi:hypothetical protein
MTRSVYDVKIESSTTPSDDRLNASINVVEDAIRRIMLLSHNQGHRNFIVRIISSPDEDELSGKRKP